MNARKNTPVVSFIIALAACISVAGSASATDTEFAYQGLLQQNGENMNGSVDLTFSLWTALAGGSQVGGNQVRNGVQVANGVFTVQLDFGASVFDNSDRWLAIVVNGTLLSPRQPITRAPYSIQTRGIFVNDAGDAGIGTLSPERVLHTAGDAVLFERAANDAAVILRNTSDGEINALWGLRSTALNDGRAFLTDETLAPLLYLDNGFVGIGRADRVTSAEVFGVYRNTTSFGGMYVETPAAGLPFYGYSAGGQPDAYHYYDGTSDKWRLAIGAGSRLTVTGVGDVGIGTDSPQARLHVDTEDTVGIWGHAQTYGILGETSGTSVSSRGVYGLASAATGDAVGVFGWSFSNSGIGVQGTSTVISGPTIGVFGRSNSNAGRAVYAFADSNTGTNFGVYSQADSTSGFDFYAAGAGTNYGSASSIRWKSNIKSIDDPLEKVLQLRGVYFDWDAEHGGHHDVGMIAEEVGAVLPEIVNYEENGIDAIGMDYSKLAPLLVEAIKALREEGASQITRQEARIGALETENGKLRAEVAQLKALVEALAAAQKESH